MTAQETAQVAQVDVLDLQRRREQLERSMGHLREDGCLVLTGRVKEMFKSGGENVTPKDLIDMAVQRAGRASASAMP
jgi:hypothetical protein